MCSQRDSFAIRRRHASRVTLTVAAGAARRNPPASMANLLVVEGRCTDFRAPWQNEVFRRTGEVDVLPDDLIGAVFARCFDTHGVSAGTDGLPRVVLSVPLDDVLPGRAGCTGHGVDDLRTLRHGAKPVRSRPRSQFRQIAGFAVVPEADGPHRKMILVLDPHGNVRPAAAPG